MSFRCPSNGNGYGYGQPHSTTNYHRTHSGEYVTKVAQGPCPAGGAVLQHHVVHKESSFKEVDCGGGKQAPRFDNYSMKANNNNAVVAKNHHGGVVSHHRYDAYEEEETYEKSCKETYARRRYDYKTHNKKTYESESESEEEEEEEEEEEVRVHVVVSSGSGCGQLRRGYRGA